MGVYIKDMKLPTSCRKCMISQPDGCGWICPIIESKPIVDGRVNSRHPHCPLVLVPPHGRLIDADTQDTQIEALIERHLHGYTKSTWDFVCELRGILKRNHTTIPAEEGEP